MNNKNKRFPLNGTFELTGRCNLSCRMCLVRVDQKRIRELGFRERTTEEWIHMAEQAAEAGTLNLLLTGGEVLIRPDFCDIYEAIAKMGFLLTVYTNATMLTGKVMELFQRYPPHKIGVTMYGASNETYQKLCGCDDGYDRFADGVKQPERLPSLLDLRTTVVKDNVGDLPQMKQYAAKLFGDEKRLHISRFVCKAVRGGICNPENVRLSPEDSVRFTESYLLELEKEIKESEAKKLYFSQKKFKVREKEQEKDGQYLFQACHAGLDQYTINWAGNMYACELLTQGYTEPFKDGFAYAWEHLPEQYPRTKRINKCAECKYAVVCETCPANRIVETGDWYGIPEYACKEARYKYKILSNIGFIDS